MGSVLGPESGPRNAPRFRHKNSKIWDHFGWFWAMVFEKWWAGWSLGSVLMQPFLGWGGEARRKQKDKSWAAIASLAQSNGVC